MVRNLSVAWRLRQQVGWRCRTRFCGATAAGGVEPMLVRRVGIADAFFRKSGRVIIPLTVREILDEHIAHKLA